LEREATQLTGEMAADDARGDSIVADFAEAGRLKSWVAANYHAQRFCHGILKNIPPNAALDRLLLELRDGQITLSFVILGDQDTQLTAHRAVERAIKDLRYKIGSEELPVAAAGSTRAVQYRLHLIVPDAGEGAVS
jgi:hypothetical protein